MGSLVDLSLFTSAPTTDGHYEDYRTNDYAAPAGHQLLSATTWPPRNTARASSPIPQACSNKPLPRVPRRGFCDFMVMDPKDRNRCILKRMRRVRLDAVLGDGSLAGPPSAYATARSAYVNPCERAPSPPPQQQSQTLQERRNPASVPQLTLPTNTETVHTQSGMQMVWLADEQMWLVADPSDPGYGYYATGPEDGMNEWLPPYTESEGEPSAPSSSDLSPVREQFMSLIEQQRRRHGPRTDATNYEEPRLSPLFQEAMQGVGLLDLSDCQVSSSNNAPPDRRPQFLGSGNQRQYIPYRSFPHIQAHHSSREQSSHTTSDGKAPSKPDLYLPGYGFKGPEPHFASSANSSTTTLSIPNFPPRSQSAALRSPALQGQGVDWSKYSSEAETKRQRERMEMRKRALAREQSRPGGCEEGEARERRDSCHSDSGVSTFSNAVGGLEVGPEPGFWGVQRASSARH
ncbi:MAG: hypothetical protein LQ340_007508 [Diploschistes diacapsis]|nr:MAG: hypothetical protein LQ340_007508 [Diploschistes diacapsis]